LCSHPIYKIVGKIYETITVPLFNTNGKFCCSERRTEIRGKRGYAENKVLGRLFGPKTYYVTKE
jgi:hypothetical protein